MKDYYYILGLDRSATESEIKEAYRKLSKKFHPDLNPNDAHSEKMFKDIQEAYECLTNYQTRRAFDNHYENSTSSTMHQSFATPHNENARIIEPDKRTTQIVTGILVLVGFLLPKLYLESEGSDSEKSYWLVYSVIGSIALTAFLAPLLIALWKKHTYKWAILAANLILGWTGLGWVACLLFSIYGDKG